MINVDNFLIRGLVLLVTCDHGLDRPPVPVPYEEEGEGQMDGGTRGNEFYLLMWLSLLPLCLSAAAGSLDRWDERWTDGWRTTPRSIPLTAAAAAIF